MRACYIFIALYCLSYRAALGFGEDIQYSLTQEPDGFLSLNSDCSERPGYHPGTCLVLRTYAAEDLSSRGYNVLTGQEDTAIEFREDMEDDRPHTSSSQDIQYRYSSFTCTGGSQAFDRSVRHNAETGGYVFGSAHTSNRLKMCRFRNVCLLYGKFPTMVFFQDPELNATLPPQFLLSSLKNADHPHSSSTSGQSIHPRRRDSFMPIVHRAQPVPRGVYMHAESDVVGFLAATGFEKYGEVSDYFFSAFAAAVFYGVPPARVQLLFLDNCTKVFDRFHYDRAAKDACHRVVSRMAPLFDLSPLYLDDQSKAGKRVCYRTVIAGAQSAMSTLSFDIMRDVSYRRLRDHAARLVPTPSDSSCAAKKFVIVPLRGAFGGTSYSQDVTDQIDKNMCETTKAAIELLNLPEYEVMCVYPGQMTLAEEVETAQKADIIVSFHGTVSLMGVFLRDNTHLIIVTEAVDGSYVKDFSLFAWTHYHTTFWLEIKEFSPLSLVAVVRNALRTNAD